MEKLSSEQSETSDRVLEFDLSAELRHGIAVSNLAYALSKELGLPHEQCYDLAIAGMLHDIGKLKLRSYINGQESNPMVIEELKYVRMHSTLGYEELKDQGYWILFLRVFFIIMKITMEAVIRPIWQGRRFPLVPGFFVYAMYSVH